LTSQVMAALAAPVTLAWNCWVCPRATLAAGGLMRTTTSITGGLPVYPQPQRTMLTTERKVAVRNARRIAATARGGVRVVLVDLDLQKVFIRKR